jgi:uncharacterized protein (DUF433 family)
MFVRKKAMSEPRIVDRGDGPKIEGTRITVYTVLEDLRNGHSREEIAMTLDLSSRQVQAAIDYIRANEDAVNADFEKIIARIRSGNPPHVQSVLEANRKKLQTRLAELQSANRKAGVR